MTITRSTPFADLPELLRPEEVATLLDTSKGLVYEMVKRGHLPCVRCGRLLRIPKTALQALQGQPAITKRLSC